LRAAWPPRVIVRAAPSIHRQGGVSWAAGPCKTCGACRKYRRKALPPAMNTGTILDRIVADKRREIKAAREQTPLAELERHLESAPPLRDFFGEIGRAHV